MKKNYFKMFIFVLMISFISTMNVHAYSEQDDLAICLNNVKYFKNYNSMVYTGYMKKTDYTHNKLNLDKVWTAITDPCTNCKIIIKPFNQNGDYYEGLVTSMGHTVEWHNQDGFSQPGIFRLGFARSDWTIGNLATKVSFTWYINNVR